MLRSALIALAVALLVPAPASAVTKYRVSLSGTFTTSGTVTSSECSDDRTLTGEARETARFRTVRPTTIYVQRRSDFPAVALDDDRKPLKASATVERTSTLEDRESPRGCRGSEPEPADCGTERLKFDIGFGASPTGVVPDLSKNAFASKPLFTTCALTEGMTGFPSFTGGGGVAKVSARRLLAGRKLVLEGGKRGSEKLTSGGGISGGGSYELKYTLTLMPVSG